MASIDLNTMSLADLKDLQKQVQRAIEGFSDRKKQEAVLALEAKAQEFGFSLSDLIGIKKKRKSSDAGGPKYRHPDSAEVTWSGRGRRPGWFVDAWRQERSRMR
jgi:DNA-binding protein H-NS